jgi:hypothetical protein
LLTEQHSVAVTARSPTEIEHKPLPARSPGGHRVDTFTLKACIDSLQRELAKVEALAASHRADFERDRAEQLVAELLKATADTARLEGELAARRSRPWWLRVLTADGGDLTDSSDPSRKMMRQIAGAFSTFRMKKKSDGNLDDAI